MLIKKIREKKTLYLELFAPPNHGLVESSKKQEERVSYSQSVSQSIFVFPFLVLYSPLLDCEQATRSSCRLDSG